MDNTTSVAKTNKSGGKSAELDTLAYLPSFKKVKE